MRARDLDLQAMLRPDPGAGRILLGQQRVLMVGADALGTLRKDLISALGVERARGFLIRYGWSCGHHDALDLRDRYAWDSEREWLQAAPYLHAQEGVARVRVERSEVDKAAGHFYTEGTWTHSYEAEQHVRHFGLAADPVCWTLCGYAGGFGTAYMGQRVIYREVACAGRGDPECRFVGRTLAEWGREVEAELPFYAEAKIAEELDRAYQEIQRQHQLLQQTAAIHDELTRLALEGKGLHEITASLSRLTGRPVVVEDVGHRLLAAAPADSYTPPAGGRNGPVGVAATASHLAVAVHSLKSTLRPRLFNPLAEIGNHGPWLAAPIAAGGRVLGYISLLRAAGDTAFFSRVLEQAASVYALDILKAQAVAEAEVKILDDLVASLLRGDFTDEAVMLRRLRHLGIDSETPHRVAVVEVAGLGKLLDEFQGSATRLEEHKQRLAARARQVAGSVAPGSTVALQGDQVALLLRVGPGSDGRRELTAVWEQLGQAAGAGIRAGAGPLCARPGEYPDSYNRARQALEILRGFSRSEGMLLHEDLGPYATLFHPAGRTELLAWTRRLLGPLLDYDARKGGELLRTLETYLRADCNLAATAQAAALHPSGLKYRLARIEDLLGRDLGRGEVRFELHLALLVARIAHLTD